MNLVNALRQGDMKTENGMTTNSTSLNACVDLFYTIGAARRMDEKKLNQLFLAAFLENSDLTMKILFWARDVRGGAGERRAFRTIIKNVAKGSPKALVHNIKHIPEFGRWDDLLEMIDTPLEREALVLIADALTSKNQLCAKWMPRKGYNAAKVRDFMGLTHKEYRKTLVNATNVVETKMCSNLWEDIEFSKVPSLAMARYNSAFHKNSNEAFNKFKDDLQNGDTTVNAGAVYPYDIIKSLPSPFYVNEFDDTVAQAQWDSLENYMEGSDKKILPVVDTSGSMGVSVSGSTTALDVAISLGMYISERNDGAFKDAFITFSEHPELQYVPNGTLLEKVSSLKSANWGMNTNLQATFELILETAKKNSISADEMPDTLLILSDMQFDRCTGTGRGINRSESDWNPTVFDMIELMYTQADYKMPNIVFWNLRTSNGVPVSFDKNDTALISGFSPSIMKHVLGSEEFNPEAIMLETISSDRYTIIES